jgi:hypothetical protein
MALFRNIGRRLDSIDQKLGFRDDSNKLTRKGKWFSGLVLTGLVGATTFIGAEKYSQWRGEYSYREAQHISAPQYLDVSSDSDANRLLAEFPIEIPGALHVHKYATPGARYCLVHIRQEHLIKDISKEELKKVGIIQGDIYKILTDLIKNHGLKEVYDEGLTPETDSNKESFKLCQLLDSIDETVGNNEKNARQRISELEEKIRVGRKSPIFAIEAEMHYPSDNDSMGKYLGKLKLELTDEKKKLPGAIEMDNKNRREKSERYQYQAVERAGLNYGLEIFPAETLRGNMMGTFAVHELMKRKNGDKELNRRVLDDREDILMEVVARQEKSLVVCVYGGAHAWGGHDSFGCNYPLAYDWRASLKDNISEWNKTHPNKKFSLIEVTPEHYR